MKKVTSISLSTVCRFDKLLHKRLAASYDKIKRGVDALANAIGRERMSEHEYLLNGLNTSAPLSGKIRFLHGVLGRYAPEVARVAVAVYDPKTDLLKTFIHSSGEADPLSNYQAYLGQVPSLHDILRTGAPRIVSDIGNHYRGSDEHSRKITFEGYRSSYTLPMFLSGEFFGFVFFNSYKQDAFATVLDTLDVYGHLISLLVINELTLIHTMISAVKTAREMAAYRDTETGAHLDRMAHFSRIIAKALAPKYGFTDEYIEHLFLFAPLHDIGKIGIPDHILLKRGLLTQPEFDTMKQHTVKGREMVDNLLAEFKLDSLAYVDSLRNITELHHEKLDASGYPHGLKGDAIPIEARIIAVADIFDALTNPRPYKIAWFNEQAYALLRNFAGRKLDADCVQALIDNREQVTQLQARFHSEQPRAGDVA